ncbi:MAG: pantetheine-phosphate adenylyltransferase [Akkermansia sp.]
MKRIGIYAGSFDPPTNGHSWMIRRGAELFDELVVVLAVNPSKQAFMSLEERRSCLADLVREIDSGNVRIEVVDSGFLVDFAKDVGASYLLRGIRNTPDFEYERTMARLNSRMEPDIRTLFLTPPSELEEISSTVVRNCVGIPGWQRWVRACVPPCVFERLSRKP